MRDSSFVSPSRILLVSVGALVLPLAASGQVDVSAYALGVGSYASESDFLAAGATWLGRGRLMVSYVEGPWQLDAAYEHVLTRTPVGGGFSVTSPAAAGAGGGDWLGTDWEIRGTERTSWRHRFDRLSVGFSSGPVELTIGRQAVSWATTLFLTPADPFAPFDPSDPFREYRGGVDAIRVRAFAGPFSEVELVVRAAETSIGTTTTVLARAQTSTNGWAVGGWAGRLHDEGAAAAFATGAVGATAVRSELSIREGLEGGTALRGTVGVDRFFTPAGKDLYLIGELQYDGFGAGGPENLLQTAASDAYLRGDLQTLGEWTLAAQASYQTHPLVGVDLLTLVNLKDGSTLVAPGLTWSVSAHASVRSGLFIGAGSGAEPGQLLGSEYGSVPTLVYASLSWFF